jgi:uncharacterized protein YbaR (Trm112 family)
MKLWLFDILACPICKHFPLKLFIFSYQTEEEIFRSYLSNYQKSDSVSLKSQDTIQIDYDNEHQILIKDNIVIEPKPLVDYMDALLSSIKELNHIEDRSPYETSKKCLNLAKESIYNDLKNLSQNLNLDGFQERLAELEFLNKLKVDAEIDSGLLLCESCKRWYPIIETIPRMLPDEYRDKEPELQFLESKKNLLDEKFFTLDLKPFALK